MNLLTWSVATAAGLGLGIMTAIGQDGAATNAPAPAADTQAVAAVSAPAPAPAPEGWTGYVRVMKDAKGDVRAIRLVSGDKLLAVELNEKAREMARSPKTQKLWVGGSLDERDGHTWLVVTDFKQATEAPPPVPVPAPAAGTQAVAAASAPASTNAPAAPLPAATNTPPAP